MEDLSIRPGFNLHAAFRGHLSPVRRIAYNGNTKQFLSMDEHCLKSWTVQRDGSTRVVHDVQFPGYQQNFITSMVLSQDLNLLFTSCLDDNLRLYNERLRLKSCMPWSNGVVREMVFYEPRSLLVTAGSYGVKVWECLLDYEAFRTDKSSDLYDVPKIKDGSVLPWCFGKYQHVRLRHTLHVPGARLMGTTGGPSSPAAMPPLGASGGSGGSGGRGTVTGSGALADSEGGGDAEMVNAPWCDRIALHEPTAMILAMFQGHVYGFDMMNGTCLSSYTNLYTQLVTSCVFVPESDLLYTTAMDTSAVLWRIPRGCDAQRFKQFGRTYAPMTLVVQDPDLKHVLTTSLDGSVTLWDMETLVPVFKMKLSKSPVSTAFYKPNAFFLATDTEVKLFTITHLFEAWMDCNSPVVSLKPLSYGLIQAEFADSSVRVLDAHDTTRLDKAVITTMPQLSSQLLVASAVSLPAARLFALLSDGTIHVWQLHLRRPPSFITAWTHLIREAGVSLAFLDGSCLSAGVSHRMVLPYDQATGITRDHLMMGTASGDCLLLDITSGRISFRFPAFKHQPLQILAADLDRGILITVSRNAIKIWNMLDVRCLHELHTSKPVTRLELLEGRAIAGTVSGSLHVVELASGASNAASVTVDHLDAVTGMGPSVFLQHVVTGSKDSHIKVFDRDKRFKRSIYVGAPVSAVTYLNDDGDILAAMGQRLVVIRADKYDKLPSAPKESLYDELRGQGRTPRILLRSMQCRLQRLCRAKPPLQVYAATVADGSGGAAGAGDNSRRRTPPLRRLQTNAMNASAAVSELIHGGGGGSAASTSGGGASFIARPRSQGGAELDGRQRSAGAGAAGASRPMSQGAGEDTRPGTRSSPSRGASRSVQWLQQSAPDGVPGTTPPAAASAQSTASGGAGTTAEAAGPREALTPATEPASHDAGPTPAAPAPTASSPRPGSMSISSTGNGTGAHAGGQAGTGTGTGASAKVAKSGGGGLGVRTAANGTAAAADSGLRQTGRTAAGGLDAEASDGGLQGVIKSEDEDEGRVIAREMYPLVYNFNLHKERMRIDRMLHGLPSIHQRRLAQQHNQQMAELMAGGGARPGSSRPRSKESRGDSRGSKQSKESSNGFGPKESAAAGGDPVPEAAAAGGNSGGGGGRGGSAGTPPLLLRLNSLRVGGDGDGNVGGDTDDDSDDGETSQDSDGAECSSASASASEAEAPSIPAGLSAAFRRTLPVIASPSAFFDGHTPPEALPRPRATSKQKKRSAEGKIPSNGAADGVDGAGAAAATTKKVAKKKKKKKKKRRRRVEMTTDLAEQLKSRLDYEVRAEVKAWEKHQTVQRLATATFLPRIPGSPQVGGAGPAAGNRGSTAAMKATSGADHGLDGSPVHLLGEEAAAGASNQHAGTSHRHIGGSGPSFRAMMKGLGVRGAVADIARMIEDPNKFVAAQDQAQKRSAASGEFRGPSPQGRSAGASPAGEAGVSAGAVTHTRTSTGTTVATGDGKPVPGSLKASDPTLASVPTVGFDAGTGMEDAPGTEGKPFRLGAIGGPGNFGLKAFLEVNR